MFASKICLMTIHAWITVVTILAVFISMMATRIPAAFIFLGGMAVLFLSGTLTMAETFGGWSSETVLLIAFMFVVVTGLVHAGVLRWIVRKLLGKPGSHSAAIVKLMLPVAALSAFLSNTVVVALFVKVVKIWAAKLKMPPSKLLIPLSYASGMGGICTIIGTPPNLIITNALHQETGFQAGLFLPLLPGLFCLTVGVLSMLAMRRLLPARKSAASDCTSQSDHLLEVYVRPNNPCVGKTLEEVGLTQYPGCRIIEITRFDKYIIPHVTDDEFIFGGDTLLLAGNEEEMNEVRKTYGFSMEEDAPQNSVKMVVASVIMMAMVVLSACGVLPLFKACILAAAAMIATGCCDFRQVRQGMEWDILIIFAGSIALGKALETTQLAAMIASGAVSLCGANPLLLLIVICATGTLLTEFISNTACAAVFFPIAYRAAIAVGANPMTFAMGLMLAVSSSFATPIGSPTHMLVFTPGGYRFTDFTKVGIPMNIIMLAANIFIVTLLFPLQA